MDDASRRFHKIFLVIATALVALAMMMTHSNSNGGFHAGSYPRGDGVARFLADLAGRHGLAQPLGVPHAHSATSATGAGLTPPDGGSRPAGHDHLDRSGAPAEAVGADSHYFYDSASPSAIPQDTTDGVAGYVNGFAWTPGQFSSFPHAYKITIDARGTDPNAKALDVEIGAAPMSTARWWAQQRNDRGYWAVVYGARATVVNLRPMLHGLHVHYWVADPSGPTRLPGATAVQYEWHGNAWDKSYTPLTLGQMFGRL
jgi:hypothetical protein